MTSPAVTSDLVIRPFEPDDEQGVLRVLESSLGGGPAGGRRAEFFHWKHYDNPFGRSFMLVADARGRVVGLRAFMKWSFTARGRMFRAVRAVDTATHPEHQGRGIFSKLTNQALAQLAGQIDFVFNTPNRNSLPGYLKMGWQEVGQIPILIRVRRPLRFLTRVRGHNDSTSSGTLPECDAPGARQMLENGERFAALLDAARVGDDRLCTARDLRYLTWRYAHAPLLDYRVATVEEGTHLRGAAFFRIRPRGRLIEATVAELLVHRDDRPAARALLRQIVRTAPVDHVACHLAPDSVTASVALTRGFLPAPGGVTFVANVLGNTLDPDPRDLRSWSLSLGDVEVF